MYFERFQHNCIRGSHSFTVRDFVVDELCKENSEKNLFPLHNIKNFVSLFSALIMVRISNKCLCYKKKYFILFITLCQFEALAVHVI